MDTERADQGGVNGPARVWVPTPASTWVGIVVCCALAVFGGAIGCSKQSDAKAQGSEAGLNEAAGRYDRAIKGKDWPTAYGYFSQNCTKKLGDQGAWVSERKSDEAGSLSSVAPDRTEFKIDDFDGRHAQVTRIDYRGGEPEDYLNSAWWHFEGAAWKVDAYFCATESDLGVTEAGAKIARHQNLGDS